MRTALFVILMAGCAPAAEAPVAPEAVRERTLEPRARAERPAPAPVAEDAPAAAAAIGSLLRARHAVDLPTRDVLDRHPEPDVALAWLARHGDAAVVRTRALTLLGLYPERDHAALLAGFAAADQHRSLRAAALQGLAGYPAADRAAWHEVIAAGLEAPEPSVALAAVRASADLPELAPQLERARAEHPHARVRAVPAE